MTAIAILALVIGYGVGRHRNPICWFDGVRMSIRTGERVDGHAYVERERVVHCVVNTAQCERCSKWNIGWERTEQS